MPYIPHTDADVREMLDIIGADSLDTLFDEIPAHLDARAALTDLAAGENEMAVMRAMQERADADSGLLCFLGAGAYEHHIPAAVWELASRGEFLTAYTPYQAEASQGTLQVIYEYQSMMAHLTGMEVSNASLYDGASGLAEAVLMSVRANRKSKSSRVLIPRTLNPLYRQTLHAIVGAQNIECVELPFDSSTGRTDLNALHAHAGGDFAALVIAQPNFFGALEDVDALVDFAHAQGWLAVASINPMATALLKAPGQWGTRGADIACGDAQPFGIPMSSGGPYVGFLCCRQEIVRQMPGRLIGRTVDLEGRPGFTLTLQAREQHIRRAKATSNICTNQGLAMTAATIYLSLTGFDGLNEIATVAHENINTLTASVAELGVDAVFAGPVFHERVLRLPAGHAVDEILAHMLDNGVLAGLSLPAFYPELENCLLVCTTETRTTQDIERYRAALAAALAA